MCCFCKHLSLMCVRTCVKSFIVFLRWSLLWEFWWLFSLASSGVKSRLSSSALSAPTYCKQFTRVLCFNTALVLVFGLPLTSCKHGFLWCEHKIGLRRRAASAVSLGWRRQGRLSRPLKQTACERAAFYSLWSSHPLLLFQGDRVFGLTSVDMKMVNIKQRQNHHRAIRTLLHVADLYSITF